MGDFNGDGLLDLVTGNTGTVYGGAQNFLYLNGGVNNIGAWQGLQTGTTITADTGKTHAVALGDVNRDGHLDLVVGNNGINRLYLGNGDGTFQEGSDITTDNKYTTSVVLGDVNGDGWLDLVAGNTGTLTGARNQVYLNGGSVANGTWQGFQAATTITEDSAKTRAVLLKDVNL